MAAMDMDTPEAGAAPGDEGTIGATFGPVGVVGAGAMGAGIAQVAATAGHPVTLVDLVEGAAVAAVEKIDAALRRLVQKGRLPEEAASAALARITPARSLDELPECGLVIE